MPSDVRVFVRFKEQCVFAGEELNCVITFKNVAEHAEPPTPGLSSLRHTKRSSISQFAAAQAAAAPNNRLAPAGRLHNARSPSVGRDERPKMGHQASYSLSTPTTPIPRGHSPSNESMSQKPAAHLRSVSIISMTSPALPASPQEFGATQGRPKALGHRRSSTVTVTGEQCCYPDVIKLG